MQALRVNGPKQESYALETVPIPEPGPRQLLVRIHAAGLCHTDLTVLEGGRDYVYPVTASHEPAGEVVALGSDAQDSGEFRVGDRVAALLYQDPCGQCSDCRHTSSFFCPTVKRGGQTTDGYFAEYAVFDTDFTTKIPDNVSYAAAASMTCAGLTIHSAIRKAGLKEGEILGISGLGAIGHFGVKIAKAMGLKVVGVDARDAPMRAARESAYPADLAFDATVTSAQDALAEIVKLRDETYDGWPGVDAMILTANPRSSHRYAADITRRHGKLILVSLPDVFGIDCWDIIVKDLSLVGSLHGDVDGLRELLDLISKHGIRVATNEYRFDQHEELLHSIHAEGRTGKSVLVI